MANISMTRLQLINFEVFHGINGNRLLGIATVDLPEIKGSTVELTGAGVSGKVDFPTIGFPESLTITLNWRSINSDLTELAVQKAVDLVLYGAEQLYDHSTGKISPQQVKINLRGIPKTLTLGKFEPSANTDSKNEIELIYFKATAGGSEIIEFDKLNYTYRVNGTDYLAETRSVLNI